MAYGDGIIDSYAKGFQIGQLKKEDAKKKLISDILASNYQPGSPDTTAEVSTDMYGKQVNSIPVPGKPGGVNWDNTIAQLYRQGLGPEAMQLEQTRSSNQLANLLKAAQIKNIVSVDNDWTEPKAVLGEGGKEIMAQFNKRTGSVRQVPGVTPRPQKPLVQIGEKGFNKVDEKYADDFVGWTTGGFADAQKSVEQLNQSLAQLKSSDQSLTGPWVGNVPDVGLQFINPQAIATREAIEEVVQRNLRLILGAQFTEKEGERLIARAFNPRLSQQENIKRAERLVSQIQSAAEAKQQAADYFNKNGTLKGFKGKTYTMADFNPDVPSKKESNTATPSIKDLEFTASKHGITVEEVKRRLGIK